MRIATWNVNSVKQRVPRLLPWLDERRPDVVCLQETKLADDAFAELLGDELADRGYEVAAHGEAAWNGVAILSRAGLEDVVARDRGRPGLPAPRGAGGLRDLRRDPRARPSTCRTAASRTPSTTRTSSSGWPRCANGRRRPGGGVVCGDMNIAPTDEDVFDPDAYVGQTHVTRARAGGAGGAAVARAARRRARPLAERARVQLLGLPRRHVPPGPRDADRPDPRRRAGRRAREGGVDRPPGPQGQRARATTRR